MQHLEQEAIRILKLNWKDGFTIPTNKLYPFQWNWDSGFTAIGQAHFDIQYAIKELQSLFSGQWENGMIPHIIFHSENETSYFPNHDFWDTQVNKGAPQKPKTSGITQPPVHGFVLEHLVNRFPDDDDLLEFAKNLFPKIVKSHRFFYTYRDPLKEGLCFIYHPWESGRDNSPLWDDSMDRMNINPTDIPHYTRKDTSIASADERPTTAQYDRYVFLLELGKKYRYEHTEIFDESPFVVQDTLMNAILIKSNQSLINLGKKIGIDTAEIEEWNSQAIPKFRKKLWHESLKSFSSFDVRANQIMDHKEVGSYISLFANIPSDEQAKALNNQLITLSKRAFYLSPSFDVDSVLFDSKRYWRGPIWPQINWMIYHGCKQYGFNQTAETVKADLIELVSNLGFHEYFEAQKHIAKNQTQGYGGGLFSWTASCVLDLLRN